MNLTITYEYLLIPNFTFVLAICRLHVLVNHLAGIIFRIFPFTIVFFDPENNVLISGSKTGVIPKICRQREVQLSKKADLQLSKKRFTAQ